MLLKGVCQRNQGPLYEKERTKCAPKRHTGHSTQRGTLFIPALRDSLGAVQNVGQDREPYFFF